MSHPSNPDPQRMIFDANLHEFATKIGLICALESSGKLQPGDAYDRIKELWKSLKRSRKHLLPDEHDGNDPEKPPF
jgi:hypothetical protein